jgi:hypothetical protein
MKKIIALIAVTFSVLGFAAEPAKKASEPAKKASAPASSSAKK